MFVSLQNLLEKSGDGIGKPMDYCLTVGTVALVMWVRFSLFMRSFCDAESRNRSVGRYNNSGWRVLGVGIYSPYESFTTPNMSDIKTRFCQWYFGI